MDAQRTVEKRCRGIVILIHLPSISLLSVESNEYLCQRKGCNTGSADY